MSPIVKGKKYRRKCKVCGKGMDAGLYCDECRGDKAWEHFKSLSWFLQFPALITDPQTGELNGSP